MGRFFRSKTTWVAIASLATVAGAYVSGQVSMGEALQVIVASLFGVTIPHVIANPGK